MAQVHVAGHGAEHSAGDATHEKHFWALTMGSVGVVYGDIGTSPLYALREAVTAAKEHGTPIPEAVIGVLSLIVWTLLLIVTVKYVLLLLNADNKGEGGTFALMSLGQSVAKRSAPLLLLLGVAGAAMFYGDAVLTPAISVLSAIEGLEVATPALKPYVVPIATGVLIGLINGILVTKVKVQAFVVTLCGLFVYRGAARWLSNSNVKSLDPEHMGLRESLYLNEFIGLPKSLFW